MNKIKELYTKAVDWHNEEVPYTKGDALLMVVVVLTIILT